MPSPEFWQLLLSAELPESRRKQVVEQSHRFDPSHPYDYFQSVGTLTDAELSRVRQTDLGPLRRALAAGVWVWTRDRFPERLARAVSPPPALFAWGDVDVLHRPTVAVIGTRAASAYGKAVAQKFAEALAESGITIVSGGALGIDAAAHEGALRVGGSTVAILPCGVDRSYPASHRGLYERIRQKGCLISALPCGVTPRPHSFLARNRITAAIADAVVVVEAPEASGSLSTANAAADENRQVFVVPGSITMPGFRGSHALIRSGATLVDHPDQVLDDLGLLDNKPGRAARDAPPDADQSPQARILRALGPEPIAVERLADLAGLNPASLLAELTILELEGRVLRADGGYAIAP